MILKFLCPLLLLFCSDTSAYAAASLTPLLRCSVTYAGTTQIIDTLISADPYIISGINIQDRFRFKPVMIGEGRKIAYIKLYAYFQARDKDVLIHQASYFPPFKLSKTAQPLTPKNALYASEAEREFQYQCTLQGKSK